MITSLLYMLFPSLYARSQVREAATEACRSLFPEEPILGAVICADEPNRYVVRVFCGERPLDAEKYMMPPWKGCLIFAVIKETYAVERIIDDDGRYDPVIR